MKRRIRQLTPPRRLPGSWLGLVMLLAAVVAPALLWASPAKAQDDGATACPADLNEIAAGDSVVRVVKVAGLINSVVADHLLAELATAEDEEALAFVVWLNSSGSVLDRPGYLELATALADSPLTTAAWVGQSGASALGGAGELLGVVDIVGVSPGSTIGSTGESRLPDRFGPAFGDATERLESTAIGAEEAVQLGISVGPLTEVATIGPFLTQIPGYDTFLCIDVATQTPRTIPVTRTELSGLPIIAQLFHTVASPEVAYLLFAIGLGLLVFELFTAGVGVAGVLGAGFVSLGSYGLASLPTRWWAIGLLLVAVVLLAVDVQTNVPRLYTATGVGVFVAATFLLYDGVTMSWVTIVSGIVGVILYAYAGMPSMVRTRFSTPTIGRRWMIGEMGEAVTDVSPEGTVRIGDASWRAVTNRATPVKAGDAIRVVGLERLLLEIEPEEGGAKDYRERR